MSRSPFRRLQNNRGTEQVQHGGDNSVNIQSGGNIHFFDIRTASQRARERVEALRQPRGPEVIEAFGKAFSQSLSAAMGPSTPVPPSPPPRRRRTLSDWWARVRTDLRILPFYNVDWIALARQAFDLDALDDESPWELVEEYGKKIALLKETIDGGDLYPPPVGREMGGPGSTDG